MVHTAMWWLKSVIAPSRRVTAGKGPSPSFQKTHVSCSRPVPLTHGGLYWLSGAVGNTRALGAKNQRLYPR